MLLKSSNWERNGEKSVKKDETKAHQWNTADTVTSLRIAASFLLLFFPLHSGGFFAAYTVAGLSDVLDGRLARKNGTASEFGARLDSMADLLFYTIFIIRFLPVLWAALPVSIWYVVAVILIVRLSAYAVAAFRYHRFASLHTWLNKLTGGAIFLIPYMFVVTNGVVYSWIVCVIAFTASFEELEIHLRSKEYLADRKSIFQAKNGEQV